MSDRLSEAPLVDWLVPFLLLGLWERDSCGHELAQRVSDLGLGAMRPEVMYRTLRQMEKEGMVVSEHDGCDGGLSRRRYSITESGEDYLEFWANSLERYQEEIDLFFRTYAG